MKTLTSFVAVFALFASFAVSAGAQTNPTSTPSTRKPSVPRLDISIGTGFFGGSGLDSADADLRGRSGEPFQLFTTTSRIGSSVPLEVRLGWRLNPRYTIEIRGAWSRPELRTSIAGDIEGASALTVAERVDLYSLDFNVVRLFPRSRPRALTPFVSAGAGYVGAVHEGLTLLENGFSYRGGGGIKYPFALRSQGRVNEIGVRADGALGMLNGGLVTGNGPTPQIAASGALYLTF